MNFSEMLSKLVADHKKREDSVFRLSKQFTVDFLESFTKFQSLESFIANAPLKLEDEVQLGMIKNTKLDKYIKKNSIFKSFNQMLELAIRYKLGLKISNKIIDGMLMK